MIRSTGLVSGFLTFITYFLLPWVGWWVSGTVIWPLSQADALPAFLEEPARLGYLAVIAGLIVATILVASRGPTAPAKPQILRPGSVYWRNITLETILVLGPFCDHRGLFTMGTSPLPRWTGILLVILGAGLALWANALREQIAARQDAGKYEPVLVVEGPFRRLRYPGYLGLLILSLGASLVFRSWLGVVTCLFMLNFIIMRINEEDQAARRKFGIQWTAYSRKSWRLIPYLY